MCTEEYVRRKLLHNAILITKNRIAALYCYDDNSQLYVTTDSSGSILESRYYAWGSEAYTSLELSVLYGRTEVLAG